MGKFWLSLTQMQKRETGYVIAVEAGRTVTKNQFLKDFYEACMMNDVKFCCIAVKNTYRSSDDFEKVKKFLMQCIPAIV